MLQLGSGQWSLAHIASPDPDPGHNYTTIVKKQDRKDLTASYEHEFFLGVEFFFEIHP